MLPEGALEGASGINFPFILQVGKRRLRKAKWFIQGCTTFKWQVLLEPTCWLSVKWAWRASHWSCEQSPHEVGEMVCFPLMGNNRTREKLWCVCPLGTLLLGLQEALLHLVCMCVCVCSCVCVWPCEPQEWSRRRGKKETAASLVCANESPLPASAT